jgi:hypothetical protein
MSRPHEIALDAFARELSKLVGLNKPLGAVEVAEDTDVHHETIRNYASGSTAPSLEWMLRFTAAYSTRFQADVLRIWNAFMGPVGFYAGPINGLDRSFLDANNDGRLTGHDSRIRAAMAKQELALYAEESNRLNKDVLRPSDAAARLDEHIQKAMQHLEAASAVDELLVGRKVG